MPSSANGIPAFYRVMLLWVEPALAVAGSLLAVTDPAKYVQTMTPHLAYQPRLQVLLDQIAGAYSVLAFNSAVVLRVAGGDLRIWNAVQLGALWCDLVHLWGTARALGLDVFLDPAAWRRDDLINIVILVGLTLVRIAFLLGLGLSPSASKPKKTL